MSRGQLFNPVYDSGKITTAIKEGQALKQGTNDREFAIVTATGDLVHGLARAQDYIANATLDFFREGGEAYALAGGAITKGARVKVTADADFVVAGAAESSIGYALEAAADEAIFRIMFTRQGV